MRICVDIDDILCDLVPAGLALYNAKTNKNIQPSDISLYYLHECFSAEEADAILEIFNGEEIFKHLKPVKDAQWGLETLINQGHNVFLATATPYHTFASKVDWVCKHFPYVSPRSIICIKDKSVLNCDVMIDDNLDNLTKNVCERIVLDCPWNRDKNKDFVYGIHRAHSWKDIIKIISEIERKEKEWETK